MRTIYLIQHEKLDTYTKIGITSNLDKRIKSLQTASPTGIHLVYSINTKHAEKIEKHLHRKYSKYNTNLEWFNLSREQIVEIIFYIETIVAKNG